MNINFVPNAGKGSTWTELGRVSSPLPPGSASWDRGVKDIVNALTFVCPCGCQDVCHIPVSDGLPVYPVYPLRDLTAEELTKYATYNYCKFEAYPPEDYEVVVGHFWTQAQLDGKSDEQAWRWDGNLEQPTLTPSIQKMNGCRWHGYLVGGQFQGC